jgi:VCBS repeat-containing protein
MADQLIVQVLQADGSVREVVVEKGAKLSLAPEEQLIIAAEPGQARMVDGNSGATTIVLEGVGEFTVETAGEIPEDLPGMRVARGGENAAVSPRPMIIFETVGSDAQNAGGAPTMEPLGIHDARVGDTGFLEQNVDGSLGLSKKVVLAAYEATDVVGGSQRPVLSEEEEYHLADQLLEGQESHAPVITGDDTGSVKEDTDVVADEISAAGTLTATDLNPGESGFTASTETGDYGTLSIDALGNWTYTADNTQDAIQELGEGVSLTEVDLHGDNSQDEIQELGVATR